MKGIMSKIASLVFFIALLSGCGGSDTDNLFSIQDVNIGMSDDDFISTLESRGYACEILGNGGVGCKTDEAQYNQVFKLRHSSNMGLGHTPGPYIGFSAERALGLTGNAEEVAQYLVDNGIVETLDGKVMYVGPNNSKLESWCADGAQGDRLCVEELVPYGVDVNLYKYRYGDAPPDL